MWNVGDCLFHYSTIPTFIFCIGMITQQHLILNKDQVKKKIKRIAFEIYEQNFDEQELILAGIADNGYIFACFLKDELSRITPIKKTLVKIFVNKKTPLKSKIELVLENNIVSNEEYVSSLQNKTIIICDDVLKTGRTLIHSIRPFLNSEIKKIQTAVLIDRNYRHFPVSTDYVGYSLSTTINEHIVVILDNQDKFGVYLH